MVKNCSAQMHSTAFTWCTREILAHSNTLQDALCSFWHISKHKVHLFVMCAVHDNLVHGKKRLVPDTDIYEMRRCITTVRCAQDKM